MEITMAAVTAIDGEVITLAKIEYILPPLPLRHMSKIKRLMSGGDITTDEEYANSLIDALWYSLNRNYPGIDRSVVEDNLDMTNFEQIVKAFMLVNKFASKDSEQGEVQAGQ